MIRIEKDSRPLLYLVRLAVVVVVFYEPIATAAIQESTAPPESPVTAASGDKANVLEQVGETLKAAVLSGALSEEDAIRIYKSLGRKLDPDNEKETVRSGEGADGPYAGKLDIMMLAAYRPGQIATLFRPEFLRRDLLWFRRELELDQNQLAIIEILVTLVKRPELVLKSHYQIQPSTTT